MSVSRSVWPLGGEDTPHQIVVHRRTCLEAFPAPPGDRRVDAVQLAEAMHPVLGRGDAMLRRKLIGDEAVAEHRVFDVNGPGGIDQVRVVPVPGADRVRTALVEAPGG